MNLKSPCLALMLVLAGTAHAQVAPPPPAEQKKEPEYRPQPAPATPQRPAAQPRQPGAGGERIESLPTEMPYPKLAQVGEDGRIVRLKDLPDVVALKANPTVGPGSVDAIMPIMYGRRARFENLVIDNLDLMWELQGGVIETMDMSDLKEITRVAEMIKPLVGRTTLSEELTNRGILTRIQGGMNSHIVREYKQAISQEIQADKGTEGMMEFMRFILQDSIHEASIAYYGLLAEMRVQADSLLEFAGVEAPELAALTSDLADDPRERDAQVEEVHKALQNLGLDKATTLLNAMRERRPNPNVSPTVVRVSVDRPGKIVTGGGIDVRIGDGMKKRDDNQIDPADASDAGAGDEH